MLISQIILQFYTQYGSITVALCVNFQIDSTTKLMSYATEISRYLNLKELNDKLTSKTYANFKESMKVQWNLYVTTTSMMKSITCDLFSNVF